MQVFCAQWKLSGRISFVKHFPEKITLSQIHISKERKKNKLKKKKKPSNLVHGMSILTISEV